MDAARILKQYCFENVLFVINFAAKRIVQQAPLGLRRADWGDSVEHP